MCVAFQLFSLFRLGRICLPTGTQEGKRRHRKPENGGHVNKAVGGRRDSNKQHGGGECVSNTNGGSGHGARFGKFHGTQRPRGEGGSGREGAEGSSNDRVAPLRG